MKAFPATSKPSLTQFSSVIWLDFLLELDVKTCRTYLPHNVRASSQPARGGLILVLRLFLVSRYSREKFMNLRKTVSLAISLLLLSTVALAQGSATGDLHIIVKDPNGGMVTTAPGVAREGAKGLERSTNVSVKGAARRVAAPHASYEVPV